jgi:NADPH2:quinone reductase
MRAVRVHAFGGPEVLTLNTVEVPECLPGTLTIRVGAAGVNPVDTYIRQGTYARLPELPYIPGWDGAGVVVNVGDGVERFKPGDRVYFSGTNAGRSTGAYAEVAICRELQVHPLPESLSFAHGAALGVPYATAHRALFHRGQARTGETVLIHGASGAVGIAALQLARAAGLLVIGTAGTEAGLELLEAQGTAHAVLHGTEESAREILEHTAGHGVDLVIEMLANVNLDTDLTLLANNGRVVVVGSRGRVEIDPRQTMMKESAILGMALWNATEEECSEIHRTITPMLVAGELRPVVGSEFPLADAPQAHERVMASGAHGKVVLLMD